MEVTRVQDDFLHFASTYCQILATDDDTGEWVPFRLWPAQEDTARDLLAHRQVILLKARQCGFTWLVVAYVLWRLLYHPIATILLFSKRDDEAVKLVKVRLKGMYDRVPVWLRGRGFITQNDHEWELTNGSSVTAFPTTGGRSYTGSLAVVDEADYVPDLQALLNAVKPAVDAGGRLILLSTADKDQPESAFKKIYRAARAGANKYHPVFHGWQARPGRSPEWYAGESAASLAETGALDNLHQEYPATDLEALAPRSLDKRIPAAWLLDRFQEGRTLAGPDPREGGQVEAWGGRPALPGLTVYVLPNKMRRYAVGADPAEGNPTSDESAAEVLDVETGEQVAELAGRSEMDTFAGYLAELSRWYAGAPVLVERNNHGHTVLSRLRSDYPKVRLLCGPDGKEGYNETPKTKAELWAKAAESFRDGETLLHSATTFHQLASIEGATLKAPEGQADDRAVAYGLAVTAVRKLAGESRVPVVPRQAQTRGYFPR